MILVCAIYTAHCFIYSSGITICTIYSYTCFSLLLCTYYHYHKFCPHAVVAQSLKCCWHQLLPTDWYDLHLPFNAKKGYTSLLASCMQCHASLLFLLACLFNFAVRASQPIIINTYGYYNKDSSLLLVISV